METASKHRTVRKRVRPSARCGSGKEGQAKVSTPLHGGHGFLNHRFEPLRGQDTLPYSRKGEALLQSSFCNLAALYGYEPLDTSGMVFPQDIAALYQQATEQIALKDKRLELLLLEDENNIRLATVKEASTGTTLFYLPVYPLWKCMKDRQRKQETDLLLSVFSYLHRNVGIPFFDGWSYIGSKYQCIQEWIEENEGDWEEVDEWRYELYTVKAAIHCGERMHRQVQHPYNLSVWEDRLLNFKRGDAVSVNVCDIADRLYKLYREYPSRCLGEKVWPDLLRPNEEYRMTLEQVFSFIWDENGWLGEQLFEMVSSELNECTAADEPIALQYFDNPQCEVVHDLDFETRLYDLLHDLSDVLRQLL